ncbi:MAG TPA: AAA family ATPase [Solirubrobacteraceae bacterium]|nr:AAA family ATPase [Solirubrobacteraceae bacterium]
MSREISTLVALDSEVDRSLIEALVARDPRVQVLDYLELGGPVASGLGVGDALVVAVADYTHEVKEFLSTAIRQHPARPVVLVCPVDGNGHLGDVLATGVEDVVALPAETSSRVDPELTRHLVFALEKALIRRRGGGAHPSGPKSTQRVICVLGLKGGSGKTLTSANLGVALAQQGVRVALVDLDLQFGDLALAMGLRPERTIYDLVRSGGSLDAEKLDDFMVEHASGARVLLAPVRPDQAAVITVPFLAEVERLLTESYEYVVIDTPPSFGPEVIGAIDSSTDVVMVTMRDTLSLKNARLGLETLERMDYDRSRVKIVFNRANTNVGIEREDVLAILGRDVDVLIPSHRDIARSINQGTPVVLDSASEAARAFRSLADLYTEGQEPPPVEDRQAARRSLFRLAPRRT